MGILKKFRRSLIIVIALFTIIGLSALFQKTLFEDTGEVEKITSSRITSVKSTSSVTRIKETKASIGSTGDILIHSPILDSCKNGNKYDFSGIFKYVKPYYQKYDYMVANLEVSLGGAALGYSGYPVFNCPDSILDALKSSGVDMLIHANNHCYDTGKQGFKRTVETIENSGMDHTGARSSEKEKPYLIKNVNNIKIGMINYTYETQKLSTKKALNGIPVDDEDAPLINSFKYDKLNEFYSELSDNISNMYKDGAEAIVLYIHWGEEYKISANQWQKTIAQKLADLGIDVVIGGHPHVIEPIELFNSDVSKKQMVCLYSTGNEISNQRKERMEEIKTGHTEDGLIFNAVFSKKSDGRVILDDIDVLPTWVNMKVDSSGKREYTIIPLDTSADWTKFGLSSTYAAQQSYNRTMKLVKSGISDFRNNYIKFDLRKSTDSSKN